MIYKQVTNIILDALSRFKDINCVRYQGDDFNNAQHNYPLLQAYVDNVQFHQFNLTTNIVKAEYNIYILGKTENNTNEEVLDVQDKAYNAAINVMAYIDTRKELEGLVSVYDFSILSLANYTAQRNAGVKLSLVLEIPNGVNICEMDNNFGEPIEPEKDEELDLNPIDLPITIRC